jgi:hypothetical protein
MRRTALALALVVPALAGSALLSLVSPAPFAEGEAQAKSGRDSAYTFEQTWNSALRLVRVDLGFKIVEKDEKAGYILFEYTDKGTTSSASLELLPNESAVRVVCQIPKFPSYHETFVLDRLAKKLKEEHGTPPEKQKPLPDAGPPEADAAP